MNSPNFLKNLVLDNWYKVFIVVGVVLFITSLKFDLKVITNRQGELLAGGLFFLGIGEWINDTTEQHIIPPNAYNGGQALLVTFSVWKPSLIGLIFDILGLVLLFSALNSIFNYPFLRTTPTLPTPTGTPNP